VGGVSACEGACKGEGGAVAPNDEDGMDEGVGVAVEVSTAVWVVGGGGVRGWVWR
jgi:hypothetical protein